MALADDDITISEATEQSGVRLTATAQIGGQQRTLEALVLTERQSPGAILRHKAALCRQMRKIEARS